MSKKFHPLKITRIERETADAVTIHFEKPATGEYEYIPGQYLTLKIHAGDEVLRRAYSLSSSPYIDQDLAVTVKEVLAGKASSFINQKLVPGDTVEVFTPMGKFTVNPDESHRVHYVLIGGGSGITPLFSITKSVLLKEPNSRVTLLYGNRTEASTIFREKLSALEKQSEGRLRVIHVLESPPEDWMGLSGQLNRNVLMALVQGIITGDKLEKAFYMCGPSGMMEEAKHALDFLSVPKKEIHYELFTAPLPSEIEGEKHDAVVAPEFKRDTYKVKVILDGQETVITVKPNEAILDRAIQEGLDPPFACQLGICTTCRAKVLTGAVEMDETEGLSDAEIEDGYILTCQAHPLSPDCIIEYG